MRTRSMRGKLTLLFMTCAVLLAVPAIALADQITNNVDATVDATAEVMPLQVGATTGNTTQLSVIPTNGDGKNGCNLTSSTSFSASVTSNNTAVATVSPNSVTFTSCGDIKTLTVTPMAQGSATISLAQTANNTGATFDLAPATFTVNVTAPPPSNTPPQVSVSGVTEGASYEKGSVPAATCQVTDAEDGNKSFAATINSTQLNQYGLGQQTASCSYTDNGDLSASTSKTYLIVDTTAPVVTVPNGVTAEATGPNGAQVGFGNGVSATDAVYGNVPVDCQPASGSIFGLGNTTVSCTATDGSANSSAPKTFKVTVADTTPPVIAAHADVSEEATGPGGANVGYASPTATDAVDSNVNVDCSPVSGSKFSLGDTTVTCTATDDSGNSATSTFKVTVADTTAPVLDLSDKTEEATGPNGAAVTYNATATDAVDLTPSVNCSPVSGATFQLGMTTVDCSATDDSGNKSTGSFKVTVVDTTPPALDLPGNITKEATGPNGNVVTYNATATDLVDGSINVTCAPASGSTFPIATTTVDCSATDAAGNKASGSFSVKVQDTTAPTNIQFVGTIGAGQSYDFGAVPAKPTCTADDAGSGLQSCVVTGYSTAVGNHTLTATATDKAGNSATRQISYSVSAYRLSGFYQPVDMNDTVNTVKNGSTVPVKFEIFQGLSNTELKSTSAVSSVSAKQVNCTAFNGDPVDEIETLATGGTSLRFDTTGDQFIYNWQTPKGASQVGKCYSLTMSSADNSSRLVAYFKLK